MKILRISFLEIKNNLKMFVMFSLLLSIIGAISISFFSFSFNVNSEINDYLFQDLNELDIKIKNLLKEDLSKFDQYYYEIIDETLSNDVRQKNEMIDGANIMYCNCFSKSNITITKGVKKDLLYNEIFVKEEYESLEKIDLIIGSETYSFDIIGYFTGIESDIIFSTELYEIQSLKDTNNIRLFFEKNDAKYVYKEITVNKYENIDYYGFIGLYDYMNISKTILTFISFFFIFVFSIILITFFDIILYRRRKYFNLLHAIGYQKKRVFLSYFFVLLFCMLEITTLMIPISLIINRVTIEILMTNFNDINIGVDFYSILIVFSINLIVVSIYLFFNLRKKLKKITIGDEIE